MGVTLPPGARCVRLRRSGSLAGLLKNLVPPGAIGVVLTGVDTALRVARTLRPLRASASKLK